MKITEPNHIMWQYFYEENIWICNFDQEEHISYLYLYAPGTVLGIEVKRITMFLTLEFPASDILQVHTLPGVMGARPSLLPVRLLWFPVAYTSKEEA